jgi:hypothetical protein
MGIRALASDNLQEAHTWHNVSIHTGTGNQTGKVNLDGGADDIGHGVPSLERHAANNHGANL